MEIGQFFRVSHKQMDGSYNNEIFFCTGVDKWYVLGVPLSPGSLKNHNIFNTNFWNVDVVQKTTAAVFLLG